MRPLIMKYIVMSAFLALVLSTASCARFDSGPLEEDLRRLDAELEKMDEYVKERQARISTIEGMLASETLAPEQKYGLYEQLYQECVAYQFDQAKEVLEAQEGIARELGDRSLLNTAIIDKAMLLTTAGMFLEAQNLFSQLDTTTFNYQQKIDWYNARQKFLHDYQEYVRTSGITVPEAANVHVYQDLILANTPKDSPLNHHIHIMRLIEEQKWEEAYDENLRIILSQNKDCRDYAVQCYWQGFICENMERDEECLKWWIESAVCDIRGAIKDNAALCSVAIKLTAPQDTDRAFRYIRISLDDAVFYNAKLRKVQIASTFPLVEKAYRDSRDQQMRDRNRYLGIVSLAALLLLLLLFHAVRMNMRQRRTALEMEAKNHQLDEYMKSIVSVEDDLRRTNLDLVEANAVKEEYLGLFLSMCSGYLDKLRKTLPRNQYDDELKNFYKTFDTSFLSLYPTFVEELNALLTEDRRIVLKDGELLNTELRIFALIKLGITQSSHIASLLRYSVNTIYNYRAQVKNSARSDRENFEENVRKIGSRS